MIAVLLLFIAMPVNTPPETQIVGDWKGNSVCTVKNSTCHDESVVYHVASIAEKPGWVSINADKIVGGKAINMGTLQCAYESTAHSLVCDMALGKFEFVVDGNRMTGTLTLKDGTVFRRIEVVKER